MLVKYLASALVLSLLFSESVYAISPRQIEDKEAARTEKVKQQAARYQVGKKVVLKLRENNRQVKGTITSLDGNGVTIAEKGSGQSFSAGYAELTNIKADGSVLKKVVTAGVVAGIVIAGVAIIQYARNE